MNNKTIKKRLKIPSHPSQNYYHEENKQQQMLMRMGGEGEPLYTVGRNVNY
jgi:hypothetical protein